MFLAAAVVMLPAIAPRWKSWTSLFAAIARLSVELCASVGARRPQEVEVALTPLGTVDWVARPPNAATSGVVAGEKLGSQQLSAQS
jgi:hypothetical protein